jgi:hypothetical protein
MADWQPYNERLRVTLTRTLSIALVAGVLVAVWAHDLGRWPVFSLLILWPSLGGHWIDLLFLNGIRPHLPRSRTTQQVARIAMWFAGGVALAIGVRLTARLLSEHPRLGWLTWAVAGAAFVVIELGAHAALHLRGRPSFYDGSG